MTITLDTDKETTYRFYRKLLKFDYIVFFVQKRNGFDVTIWETESQSGNLLEHIASVADELAINIHIPQSQTQ